MKDDPDRAFRLVGKSRMDVLSDYAIWFGAKLQGKALDRSLKTLASAKNKEPVIEAVALGLKGQRGLEMPRQWKSVSKKLYASSNAQVAKLSRVIGSTFGDTSLYPEMRTTLADTGASLEDRRAAFSILSDANDPESVDLIISLLDDGAFTTAVIELAPQLDRPDMAELLIVRFAQFSEKEKGAAINALTKRESMAVALLTAIQEKRIAKKNLTAYHARELSLLNSDRVEEGLSRVWGRVKDTPQDVAEKIQKLDTFYSQAPLWAFKLKEGKSHFQSLCSACHQPNDNNLILGPDLTGSGGNGARYFLENIIDPNAVVGSDYELTIVETQSGQIVSGMLEQETDTAVSIQTLSNTVTVARSDISNITRVPESMMPPGLMDTLTETQQVELLKYLTTL
jgi:putative heme-binding domain-containing protein